MNALNCTQLVEEITRPNHLVPSSGTIIDLVFSNRPDGLISLDVIDNPVISDHHAVSFNVLLTKPYSKLLVRNFLAYHKTDIDHLKKLVHLAPWNVSMDENSVDNSWDIFTAIVRDSVPLKSRKQRKHSPWVTNDIKQYINIKHRLFRKAKRIGSVSAWDDYKYS
ncbi:uncharacterized protein [Antedon mediterranea]|uniref:uncharacterized protein n=1 Tax=Antedon mediterranea TaxID=105859 RepID=UPI003AF811E2